MIGFPEETEEAGDRRKRENIGPAQPAPDSLETRDTTFVGLGSVIRCVDCTHRCANNEIWNDAAPSKCREHADLSDDAFVADYLQKWLA